MNIKYFFRFLKPKAKYLFIPLLIAIYPVFHIYSGAVGEVIFIDFLYLILSFTLLVPALFFTLNLIYKDEFKASVSLSVFFIMFYLFSPVYSCLENLEMFGARIIRFRYFFPFWCFLILLFSVLIFKIKKTDRFFIAIPVTEPGSNPLGKIKPFYFQFIFNFFLFLVLFYGVKSIVNYKNIRNLISTYKDQNELFLQNYEGQFELSSRSKILSSRSPACPPQPQATAGSRDLVHENLPDIYFIILDRYPSGKVLSHYFNYDNRAFLDSLRGKGFYIADNAHSNYISTAPSIPSSLSMNYHFVDYSEKDKFLGLASYILKNNNAAYFLKSLGYDFFNIPSSWGPARKRIPESLNIDYSPPSEFYEVFFGTTMIGVFWRLFFEYKKTKTILGQMNAIKKIVKYPRRKFVFAHISAPHDPFVFNKKGKFVYFKWPTDIEAYLEQLQFVSSEIDSVINEILENSKQPPIIILQSDHGVHWEEELFDKSKMTKEDLRDVKYGILSAYYLPTFDKKKLWDTISPVNNFRLIFNHYFGTKFKILPDKSK